MTHDEPKSTMMQTMKYVVLSSEEAAPSLLSPYAQKQNKTSFDEVAKTSVTNKPGAETTGLDEYVRTLYRRFPSIDDTTEPFT
jgi:hypothetical protein